MLLIPPEVRFYLYTDGLGTVSGITIPPLEWPRSCLIYLLTSSTNASRKYFFLADSRVLLAVVFLS